MGRTHGAIDAIDAYPPIMMLMASPTPFIKHLRAAHALIFDFDGTLVDSNSIKRRAFDVCFSHFPEWETQIKPYCYGNNHIQRQEKFQHIYEHILKKPYTPEIAHDLHRRYEEATTLPVSRAREIPGAEAFLARMAGRYPTAVVSTPPNRILHAILQARGWTHYFVDIQGAPVNKTEWVKNYAQRKGLNVQQCLFFGDTPEDARAAYAAGCPFVAVGNDPWITTAVVSIPDYREVLEA